MGDNGIIFVENLQDEVLIVYTVIAVADMFEADFFN